MELVKQHAESSDKTYVQKAYDKSLKDLAKSQPKKKKPKKPTRWMMLMKKSKLK
jgi:hypothetical protein